jgi:inosine/xanthosine triphosphate pyrophosphatase family protein
MFIPEANRTFAEMTDEEKNQRSHRGQAARLMRELMQQRWLK